MDFIKACKYQLIMLSQINRNSFDVLVRALPTTIRSEVMLGSFKALKSFNTGCIRMTVNTLSEVPMSQYLHTT